MVSREQIDAAVGILRSGGLVAFPTETVYGLGAHALDPLAVARIYAAKSRPQSSPLIVHVHNIDAARRMTSHWPEAAERLAQRFWPGPLTLVLPKISQIPDLVTAGLGNVGLRVPAHPVALALLTASAMPLAAPSANRFTEVSPTTAQHVAQSLGDRVDLILDGGSCSVGIESTVLSLAGDRPVLLRPGMLGRQELEEVLGQPLALLDQVSTAAHPSPGLSDRHYAPRTPLLAVASAAELPASGRGLVLLLDGTKDWSHFPTHPMPSEPRAYAQVLYQVMRSVDAMGLDWIGLQLPPATPAWDGINDRLRRAAQKNNSLFP